MKAMRPPRIYLPAYLCSSVYECAIRAGVPITYLDLVPGTYEQNFERIHYEKGSILLLVHQYGIPSNPEIAIDIARKHNLIMVEDNAAAFGAQWKGLPTGSFGDAAIVSFEYSKAVSACRGGAALFKNEEFAVKVENYILAAAKNDPNLNKTRWWSDAFEGIFYNVALQPNIYGRFTLPLFDAKNGAFIDRSKTICRNGHYGLAFGKKRAYLALKLLKKQSESLESRRAVVRVYEDVLKKCKKIVLANTDTVAQPSFTHYPVLVPAEIRMNIVEDLWKRGVDPGFNFSYLCGGVVAASSAPVSQDYTRRILTLPVSSHLSPRDALYIAHQFVVAVEVAIRKNEFTTTRN